MKFSTFTIARADTGAILPFCVVTVYLADGVTKATLYNAGGSGIGNPLTADVNGSIGFAATNGTYILKAVSADGTYTVPNISVDVFDMTAMVAALAAGITTGIIGKTYATKALMNADLVPADGIFALVYNDSTAANNDLYRKTGATGAGSWSATGLLSSAAAGYAAAAAVSAATAATAANSFSAVLDHAILADRNIFNPAAAFDNSQMTAYAGAGTGGVISTLSGQFVTPLMLVTQGATYKVPFNVTRGVYFDATGATIGSVSAASVDTYNFTVTVPSGGSVVYMQIQGDKNYIAAGSMAAIDVHTGSRTTIKGFELLEKVGASLVAQKAARATLLTNTSLMSRIELKYDYVWNISGVLTASGGSQCWATNKFRVDEVRGFTSNQPIVLTNGGVSFFDIDGNFLFANGTTFTAVLNGTSSINVTATSNGKPLCKGALVDCATGGYVPGLAATGTLYITGVPANGAATGTYTLSGNALASATRSDMRSGGMAANVTLYPPSGFGVEYAALALYYYFASATPDTWNLSDGPLPAATATSGASIPSLSLGLTDLELLFPWYKAPMAAFGNSVTAGYFYDYFEQVTKCDLQIRAGVAATQLHEFLDGPRVMSLGQVQNRNSVTGDINGPITAAAMAPIKGYTVGPLGGNEFGFVSAGTYGNDTSGVTHRQPYPIGTVGYTAPVAVFQVAATASSTTITVSNTESGVIIPGTSCLLHPTAPYGLPGRYIASQTGVTSVTGATASFSGTTMTVTGAGSGSFAVGQTVTGANVPANTWIQSLGTGAGGTGTYTLNKSAGTIAAQAVSATNAGGNGTYLLDASTGVTTGAAAWTMCGTYYGSLYWFFITKMGAWAPGAVPFLKTMYPRYDGGASNGGPTDPTNPGNPINTLGNRITDYNAATLSFRDKLLHAPIVDNYAGTASTSIATAQALSPDMLHPLLGRPASAITDAGAHWYAGRVGRVVNHYSPIFA